MNTILLGFLILGVYHAVLPTPLVDDDYQYDYDYDYGYDESISDHTTNAPPYFETTQYKKSAHVGDNITLQCNVKNLAASYFIMWYNRTTLLSQIKFVISTDSRISVDDNYSLRINGVRESDAGQYQCKVLPHSISMLVNLEIAGKPTAVILDMDGRDISGGKMTYHQGDHIEIECKGIGNPPPQIKWFSNGERIASGDNNVQVNNGDLIIEYVDQEHAKLYQCLADNEYGVSHATFSINVRLIPNTTEQVELALTPITYSNTVTHIEPTACFPLLITLLIVTILNPPYF